MKISIPYGRGAQTCEAEDSLVAAVLTPREFGAPEQSAEQMISRALEHPKGSPRLCDLAAGKRRVTLITSDHTRAPA